MRLFISLVALFWKYLNESGGPRVDVMGGLVHWWGALNDEYCYSHKM